MVLHDDVDLHRLGKLAQPSERIDRRRLLLLGRALALQIDANRPAAQEFRRLHPLLMIVHRRHRFFSSAVSQWPLVVHHEQMIHDSRILAPSEQFLQITGILRRPPGNPSSRPPKKPIDILHRRNPELLLRLSPGKSR